MEHPVTIVVLSKYAEVFQPFFESVEKFCPDTQKILVKDNDKDLPEAQQWEFAHEGWTVIKGPAKFSMAGNGNIGLKAVLPGRDILYCGDDIRFLKDKTVEILQKDAYSDDKIGILSPRLMGRGSPSLVNPQEGVNPVKRPIEMWFPCVYIKWEVIDKIGYLDEQFNEFGSDDLDFCVRMLMEGYRFSVTSHVAVHHLSSSEGGPTTFVKKIGAEEWQKQQQLSYQKIRDKWNVSFSNFDKFLGTGDVAYMKATPMKEGITSNNWEEGLLCSEAEAKDYLKTRHIHLATPAYGGWLSVNYVHSLLALTNMCRDLEIQLDSSFIFNESLITRARNRMVQEYFEKEKPGTDFFFIDADIGFDARDIIMLTLRREDIIGAPCVRKNLRLDRVANAVKANGRDYSIDELSALTGEYVVNFAVGQASNKINLGSMIEVLDVGTGLMRIRKETFEKFRAAYPDRWFLQMTGEFGGRTPTYMYFQAGMDENTRQSNPGGYPDYIPEDYWFCREARRAGMKVWLAPWLKTTHMGSHMYIGDLQAVAQAGGALR